MVASKLPRGDMLKKDVLIVKKKKIEGKHPMDTSWGRGTGVGRGLYTLQTKMKVYANVCVDWL